MHRGRQVEFGPVFGVKQQRYLLVYERMNGALDLPFSKSVEPLLRNRDPNMNQNEQVYAICYRPEVAGDVTSSRNVKIFSDNMAVNFEVDSWRSFCNLKKKQFAS